MPKKLAKKNIPLKPVCHIYCEGETEGIYFEKYIDRFHSGSRQLKLEPTNKNTPQALVDEAIEAKNNKKFPSHDTYWVVYDREGVAKYSASRHQQARSKALSNGINIAFSNVCFEVWLLLHFTTVTAPYTSCDNFLSQSPFKPELAKRGITTYDKTSKNAREVADLCLSQDILGTTKNRAIKMNDNTTATAAS